MFSWRSSRPGFLIVAHRGASELAPENTLASFRRAIADGAHAVELDARLTADGRVVAFHDRTLGRITGGKGRIEETDSATIRAYSAGRWFNDSFAGERVPFLEEVLELTAGRIGVNIELKFPTRRSDPAPLVKRCAGIVRGFPFPESILVTSFHHRALEIQRRAAPETAIGVLVYPPGVPTTSGVRKAEGIGALSLIYSGGNIRKRFVALAGKRGLMVLEYTVNSLHRLRRARRMGVDGVITNAPGRILRGADRTVS